MARSNVEARARSARTWALAGRQHGMLARSDLLALGFTPMAIDHRVAQGRLHLVARGVYAVGWPTMTQERRWMAALLACGEGPVLSHRSAAALWGIGKESTETDISVRRRCNHRRTGIRARCRPSLPEQDVTEVNGIPVTTPARTLLDLATMLGAAELERAVNEADKLDLIDPEALRTKLADFAGEPGMVKLRALLDRDTFRLSDSELERLFRRIVTAIGLPLPLTKEMVNGFEVDFFWPELGIVVETDGLRYHRTPAAQARDRLRDQAHQAAGLIPLRFTYHQIKYNRAHVIRVLRATAAAIVPGPRVAEGMRVASRLPSSLNA